jgi:hypothetical protein
MQVDLTPAECAVLVRLVETELSDTRVEVRRTRTPDFHDALEDEKRVLRGMLEKLRT